MGGRSDKIRKAAQARGAEAGDDRRTKFERAALGSDSDPGAVAFVVLRYLQHEHECFSEWTPEELRAFSEFNRKVSQQTWEMIQRSGGKAGTKTGLGCTLVRSGDLPSSTIHHEISEDLTWMEMRVTLKARVFGFRARQAFFLVFLDRNHAIFPE